MDWACGTRGRQEEVHTEFWEGNLMERDHLVDVRVDGRIILEWILKKWDGAYGLD
jgi:hypothetical protein